jgi:hypothetical protein
MENTYDKCLTCVKLVLQMGPSVSRLNTTVKTCEEIERCHANVVLSASVHQCMHIINGLVLLCSTMDILNGLPKLWYKTYHIFLYITSFSYILQTHPSFL